MAPIGLSGQDGAGFNCATINMDDTSTALTGVAADMRSCQVEVIAQKLDQKRSVFEVNRDCLTIHRQVYHFSSHLDSTYRRPLTLSERKNSAAPLSIRSTGNE